MTQYYPSIRYEFICAIFLYLNKAHNTLDREIFLGILEVYSVVPWSRCLLHMYWYRLAIVARAEVYYSSHFKGCQGVT